MRVGYALMQVLVAIPPRSGTCVMAGEILLIANTIGSGSALHYRMFEVIFVIGIVLFICLIMTGLDYIDFVEYAFPKVSKLTARKRLFLFMGYFLLKLCLYFIAFNMSLIVFFQPSLKQVFFTEFAVVLIIKYIFALVIKSEYKYALVAIELPVLFITLVPVSCYCWEYWEWIGD